MSNNVLDLMQTMACAARIYRHDFRRRQHLNGQYRPRRLSVQNGRYANGVGSSPCCIRCGRNLVPHRLTRTAVMAVEMTDPAPRFTAAVLTVRTRWTRIPANNKGVMECGRPQLALAQSPRIDRQCGRPIVRTNFLFALVDKQFENERQTSRANNTLTRAQRGFSAIGGLDARQYQYPNSKDRRKSDNPIRGLVRQPGCQLI